MTAEVQELIDKEIHRIVKGIEAEFDVSCELEYISDYPPLYNDPEITAGVVEAIENSAESEINKIVEFPMFSGSEDFHTTQQNSRLASSISAANRKAWKRLISTIIRNGISMKMHYLLLQKQWRKSFAVRLND